MLLGLLFPIGLVAIVSGGHYLVDRASWAAGVPATLPPDIHFYFSVPDPWLLLLFLPAFAEECIFRGLLQPCFIGRYGLNRGILLTGIVWAAFHFHGDPYGTSAGSAAEQLGIRIGLCLAQTFVLAWLTLRSRSLMPSTIAHALYNVGVFSPLGLRFYGERIVVPVLWALLAALLFRYWPPAEAVEEAPAEPSPELAV